jgi:hypothetical protein
MRNRTPTAIPVGGKTRSPIQRTNSRDKTFFGHTYHLNNSRVTVISMVIMLSLGLMRLLFSCQKFSHDTSVGTFLPSKSMRKEAHLIKEPTYKEEDARKAAQDHHEKDQMNLQQAEIGTSTK